MSTQVYRLDIAADTGFAQTFSPDTGDVFRIETELKKEKHRISFLTASIYDPKQKIFSALPDCAYANVPVKLYLAKFSEPLSASTLVFEGKVTQYMMGYPSPEKLTIVAHDDSIDLRKKKKYRTFKNLTSVQLAKAIAKEYGFEVDVGDLGDVALAQRKIEFGAEMSDYALIGRSLAADGLEIYTKGKKLFIRQSATTPYPVIFKRDQAPVLNLEVQIQHVSAGGSQNKQGSGAGPLQRSGDIRAATGNQQTEADNTDTVDRTHRTIPSAQPKSQTGSHHESAVADKWTNLITGKRRRKDTASLTLMAMPDFGMQHVANLSGWGDKVDRTWWPETIRHVVLGDGGQPAITSISLTGPPSQKTQTTYGGGLPLARSDIIKP